MHFTFLLDIMVASEDGEEVLFTKLKEKDDFEKNDFRVSFSQLQ